MAKFFPKQSVKTRKPTLEKEKGKSAITREELPRGKGKSITAFKDQSYPRLKLGCRVLPSQD